MRSRSVAIAFWLGVSSCSSSSQNVAKTSTPGSMAPVGQTVTPTTKLPALPTLTNVAATLREDSVGIDFDPVDDAVDYRVYPLPDDSDITLNANGSVTVKNAIYRCAGQRQAFDLPTNLNSTVKDGQTAPNDPTLAIGGGAYPPVSATIPTTPTLGYVYVTPGDGLVPVYAIGVHPNARDEGWRESRPKIYTTDAETRKTLLAQGGRNDGIVFYVPQVASSTSQTLLHSEKSQVIQGPNWTQFAEYYFLAPDQSAHASDTVPPSPAFQVLTAATPGAVPLMSVLYQSTHVHTELAAGKERFKRAANQGPGPLWHLEWVGITKPTVLVVEALSSGCPYQGFLSPEALNASPHQSFFTLEQLQAASPTGEVFINGQFDWVGQPSFSSLIKAGDPVLKTTTTSPIATARSFVQVSPQPHDPKAWDWYEGFSVGSTFGTPTPAADSTSCSCQSASSPPPCNSGSGGCGYWTSPTLNMGIYEVDNPSNVNVFASGQFLGQFWDAFDDWGQDVTATVRFTSPAQATVSSDPNKFLHVTWSVNTVGTDRRYPQMIVSDQPSPVQDGFRNPNSNFLLIQTINGPSMRLQVEAFHGLFNGSPWAVNNQAPFHALVDYDGDIYPASGSTAIATIPPADSPFEHAGVDRLTQYDAYISSSTLYVFMDGAPAGCTQYPANGFSLQGTMSVTFGDEFYHEGAPDELVCYQSHPFAFNHQHECSETKRHWDDLGFKSGVDAPKWDTSIFPCAAY